MTMTTEQYPFFLMAIFVYIGIVVVAYVVGSFLLMKTFQKAGVDSWKAWVPFVNTYYLLVMGGRNGWLFALAFIPVVGPLIYLVFLILAMIEINKRFQQSGGMLALLILLPAIYYAIIGFGQARWHGPEVNSGQATPPASAQYPYPQPVPSSPQGYAPAAAPGYASATPAPAQTTGDVLLGSQPDGHPVFYNRSSTVITGGTGSGKSRLAREIILSHLSAGGFLALISDKPQEYSEFQTQGFASDGATAVALIDSIGSSLQGRMASIAQGANVAPILIVADSVTGFPEAAAIIERLDRMATVSEASRVTIVVVAQAPLAQVGVLPTPSFPTRIEKSTPDSGRIVDFTSERNFSVNAPATTAGSHDTAWG